MLSDIDKARKRLEISKVRCAKEEMEFKVLERLEDIKRLEDNIRIQAEKLKDLEAELQGD